MRSSGPVGHCCTRDLWRCSREGTTNPPNPKAQQTPAANRLYFAWFIVHRGSSSGSFHALSETESCPDESRLEVRIIASLQLGLQVRLQHLHLRWRAQ